LEAISIYAQLVVWFVVPLLWVPALVVKKDMQLYLIPPCFQCVFLAPQLVKPVLTFQILFFDVSHAFKVLSSLMETALNALAPTAHPANLPTLPHALLANNHSCSPTHHVRTAYQTAKLARMIQHVIPAAMVTYWSGPKMVRSLA
jgi:hypothetical protein